jgi:hypothetical protein
MSIQKGKDAGVYWLVTSNGERHQITQAEYDKIRLSKDVEVVS